MTKKYIRTIVDAFDDIQQQAHFAKVAARRPELSETERARLMRVTKEVLDAFESVHELIFPIWLGRIEGLRRFDREIEKVNPL